MPAIIRRKLWQTAIAVMAMHLLLRRPVFPVRERDFEQKLFRVVCASPSKQNSGKSLEQEICGE